MSATSAQLTRRTHPPHPEAISSSRLRSEPVLYGLLGIVLVLVVWEVVVDLHLVRSILVSSPSRIFNAAREDFTTGVIWPDLSTTLFEWTTGFVSGLVVAIPLGLVLGSFRRAEFLFDPILAALYATPIVALVPMIILLFGVGIESKIFVVWLETSITAVIITAAGPHAADRRYVDIARSFGASRGLLFRSVILPTTVPYIITAVRLGAGRALIGVIVAEFIASNVGIGFYITFNGTLLNTSRVMLGVILIGAFGMTIGQVIRRVERHFDRWRAAIE